MHSPRAPLHNLVPSSFHPAARPNPLCWEVPPASGTVLFSLTSGAVQPISSLYLRRAGGVLEGWGWSLEPDLQLFARFLRARQGLNDLGQFSECPDQPAVPHLHAQLYKQVQSLLTQGSLPPHGLGVRGGLLLLPTAISCLARGPWQK